MLLLASGCHDFYRFFEAAKKKNNQPAMKKKPPKGVIMPTYLIAGEVSAIRKMASAYKEPENKTMPAIKQLPAHLAHLSENFSGAIPIINNANA